MNIRKIAFCGSLIALLAVSIARANPAESTPPAGEIGEVEIREVLPLSAAQRAELARMVSSDAEAGVLRLRRLQAARPLLNKQWHPRNGGLQRRKSPKR